MNINLRLLHVLRSNGRPAQRREHSILSLWVWALAGAACLTLCLTAYALYLVFVHEVVAPEDSPPISKVLDEQLFSDVLATYRERRSEFAREGDTESISIPRTGGSEEEVLVETFASVASSTDGVDENEQVQIVE